jgi:hypothetical protein
MFGVKTECGTTDKGDRSHTKDSRFNGLLRDGCELKVTNAAISSTCSKGKRHVVLRSYHPDRLSRTAQTSFPIQRSLGHRKIEKGFRGHRTKVLIRDTLPNKPAKTEGI